MKKQLSKGEVKTIVTHARNAQAFITQVHPNADLGVGAGWAALTLILEACGEPTESAPWTKEDEARHGR